jgi:hypothetical protein
MRNVSFALSLCLAALLAMPATSQVLSGTISGTVVDQTDARIPSAKITATDLATNREYQATSDAAGAFRITSLPYGFYRVVVEAAGFTKTVVERVQVTVSGVALVEARMEVARVGTEVVVEALQSVLQTESVEIKNTIDRALILNMPLPTRNPLDLVRTMAGIAAPTVGLGGDAYVHGLRGSATNLTQDGINVADNFVKTSAFFAISAPIVDSIGEFNVSLGGIGADAGFGAAQVSMVTTRGTNDFHGSVLWFQRNNFLNANTWFNNAAGHFPDGSPRQVRPYQLQNRVGINGGAPVFIPKLYDGRNRTFIFGSYEAFREPLSRPRTRTVMTPSARTGLFTYTPTTGGGPRTVNLLTVGTIGNTGAAAALNQSVMNFYNSLVPTDGLTDSGCTGDGINIRCYPFNLPGRGVQDRYAIRVDHNLTDRHSLEFVFNQADFDNTPDLLNGIEPAFPKSLGGGQRSRRQVLVWGFTSVFASNKTNDFRFGYQRAPVAFALDETFAGTQNQQLQYAGVTSPTFTWTNLPQGRNTPVRQWIDNFNWVKGSHNMRMGGEYRQVLANSYFYNMVTPRIVLGQNSANPNGLSATTLPGISPGDLTNAQNVFHNVTGLLSSLQQGFNHTSPTSGFVPGVPRIVDPIQHYLAFYWQDTWRFRPKLNIQYGIRYELPGVVNLRNKLALLPVNGLEGDVQLNFAGPGTGRPIYQTDKNNFAPFAGFAWSPGKGGKTTIRASFSSHYLQDGFTVYQLASTGNTGLFATPTNTTPTGVFRTNNPLPSPPVASFPVSQRANFLANSNVALWDFPKDFVTPYVLGWNFGIQRELWKRLAFEVRYTGNHAVKGIRSYSINEIDLSRNNLLGEFVNAQRNLSINAANARTGFANSGLAGQVPTPLLDTLFRNVAAGSAYSSSGFITNLQQNQVGAFWDTIRRSPTYLANRDPLGLNFFVPSPYAANAFIMSNNSWSYYHGLEVELNRRFSTGLFLTSNYTYSKVLADTSFVNSQTENQNYRSINNPRLDKAPAGFDVTQSFNTAIMYTLPIGRGKTVLGNAGSALNLLVGGWQLQSFTRWSTGSPFTISSGRATTGSLVGETAVIRNMTADDISKNLGVFRHGSGVYWINPSSGLLNIVSAGTSRAVICTPGQTTPCFDHPGPGEFGNLPVNGFRLPRFFNQDFSVNKMTRFYERYAFEIRLEMYGAFNNPNFSGAQTNIESTTFGRLQSTVDTARGGGVTSRIIAFGLKFHW